MTSNFSLSALEEQHLIMKLFKTELISHYFILHYLYHSSFVLFWGRTKLRGKPDRLQVIKHASKASPACHSLSAAAHRSVETPSTQNHIIILRQRWKFRRIFQRNSLSFDCSVLLGRSKLANMPRYALMLSVPITPSGYLL